MKRWVGQWPVPPLGHALAAAAALALLQGPAARASTNCPPPPGTPTAQQLDAARTAAKDRGFLWRISRDGATSYLYGTIHLGRMEWVFPGPTVRAALQASDTLAVELDLTDPAVAQAMRGSIAGQPDALLLPQSVQRRLVRQAEAACLPAGLLDQQHPLMQAITLTVLSGRNDGLEPAFAQEIVLGEAARAAGARIVSLETVQQQLAALIPREEASARSMLERTLQQLETGAARRAVVRLAEVWAGGRLAELEQYDKWCECVITPQDRDFLRRVNDDRNPGLARRIDALHGSGRRVFAAVGALHMTGHRALPELLAQRGFTVERIAFGP
ncbi:MAG: TraB/GumN family protein [Rubrivivax sp.]